MINFLLCTVLPPGPSEVDQTNKFDDLTQLYKIWPHSVLIEMNDVNNVIFNNFKQHDQLPTMQHFLSRSL